MVTIKLFAIRADDKCTHIYLGNSITITSWEIDGETVETVSDFVFLGSKITADGDSSHELKDAYSLEGKL